MVVVIVNTLQLPPELSREVVERIGVSDEESPGLSVQSPPDTASSTGTTHSQLAQERLLKDFYSLQNTSLYGLSGAPREQDIFSWDCVVCGLPDTIFENGTFELTLTFTTNYPFQAPSVRFITDIFHPNISPAGILTLDQWTPALDVTELLSKIQCLLSKPDLSSVVNHEAARLYREDRREYARRVKRLIEEDLEIFPV